MSLIRSRQFQEWYLNTMVEFVSRAKAIDKAKARVELADSLVQEMNSLHFMIENIYPHSRPSNDDRGFLFITNPIEHDLYTAPRQEDRLFYPGRLVFSLKGWVTPSFEFPDEPTFQHGHLLDGSTQVRCWGHFQEPFTLVNTSGLAGLLAEMHLFACKARYGSRIHGKKTPVPGH